jgi:hypothetical protein
MSLETSRTVYRCGQTRGSMALLKASFLSIICAKLRTEVAAVRRPPKFKVAVGEPERLVAESAPSGATVD